MLYWLLLVLGLMIGAGFLVVLLVGDKREAKRAAQRKALQEQVKQASEPVEGVWPPPPDASALSHLTASAPLAPPARKPGASRQTVRVFFAVRNCAIGAVLIAYLVCTCFPRLPFGWVLLATVVIAAVVLAVSLAQRSKSR